MRILNLTFLFILFAIILSGCDSSQPPRHTGIDPEQMKDGKLKDGEQLIYYKDGNLKYRAEIKDGLANGRVRQYYTDGKIYMDGSFKGGYKEGKSTFFFKNGKPFSETYYVHGEKEGKETKYWEDGSIYSVCEYHKDMAQPGLKEYTKSGTLLENEMKLIIKEIDHTSLEGKFYLKISLSNPEIVASFYSQVPSEQTKRQKLKKSGNEGILVFDLAPNDYIMKKLILDAEYKTARGNINRIQRTYNLVVD